MQLPSSVISEIDIMSSEAPWSQGFLVIDDDVEEVNGAVNRKRLSCYKNNTVQLQRRKMMARIVTYP
jgi:hypothetical protein